MGKCGWTEPTVTMVDKQPYAFASSRSTRRTGFRKSAQEIEGLPPTSGTTPGMYQLHVPLSAAATDQSYRTSNYWPSE